MIFIHKAMKSFSKDKYIYIDGVANVKGHTMVTFLDIVGAFNNINHGVNPTITELLLINRKRKKPDVEQISLGCTFIPFADSEKYLGVMLGFRVLWRGALETPYRVKS